MNITTYIRKEDEHLWKAIPNKAEWLHTALNSLAKNPAKHTLRGKVLGTTPLSTRAQKVPAIPGLTTAAQLDEPKCPRHHVAKSLCVGRH